MSSHQYTPKNSLEMLTGSHSITGAALPLGDFTIRAVIDWVEFEVHLSHTSQFRHVQDRIERVIGDKVLVAPIGADASGTTQTFQFKLQDPLGPADAEAQLQNIFDDLAEPPRIVAVEVAVDAYHRRQDPAALVSAAWDLFRRFQRLPSRGARATGPSVDEDWVRRNPGKKKPRGFRDELGRSEHVGRYLAEGWTINVGRIDASFTCRFQVKVDDHKKGISGRSALLPREHRARAEVTLRGPRVPFSSFDQWRAFRFETLTAYFSWRTSVPNRAARNTLIRDQVLNWGHYEDERIGGPTGRRAKFPRWTMPDRALNAAAKNALKMLDREQRRSRRLQKFDQF